MNNLSLLTDLYKEDKESGALKLDLNFARKKIKDKKLGDLTILEALFNKLDVTQTFVLFKLLREHQKRITLTRATKLLNK